MKKIILIAVIFISSINLYSQKVGISDISFTPQSLLHLHNNTGSAYFQITNSTTLATSTDGIRLSLIDENLLFQNQETDGSLIFTIASGTGKIVSYFDSNFQYELHGAGGGTNGVRLKLIANGGTYASPLKTVVGQKSIIQFMGYGVSNGYEAASAILAHVTQDWDGTDRGMDLQFKTNPDDTDENKIRLHIHQDGYIAIGNENTAPDGLLHLDNGTSDTELILEKDFTTSAKILFYNDTDNEIANISLNSTEDIVIENDDSDSDIIFKINDGGSDTEMIRIDGSTSRIGIGTSSPASILDIAESGTAKANTNILAITNTGNAADMDGTSSSILFNQAYSGGTIVDAGSMSVITETDWTSTASTQDAYMTFNIVKDGVLTERFRLNSNGNFGIGIDDPEIRFGVAGTNQDDAWGAIGRFSNDAEGARFSLTKSRGGTIGTKTAVQSGDVLGELFFSGVLSGNNAYEFGAGIKGVCTGAPNTTKVPGKLVFMASNTTDGVNVCEVTALGLFPCTGNSVDLGSSGKRWDIIYYNGGSVGASDIRLKKNINNINYGLKDLLKLRPVTFNWKNKKNKDLKIGLIAQELQKIIPEVVNVGDDKDKTLGVFYTDLIPVLIKSIQEQQEIINIQKVVNEKQSKQIEELLNRVNALEK